MFKIAPSQIENAQQLTATVQGPDGANTLIVLTGQFFASLGASPNTVSKETFAVLLGPALTRRQFVQGVATASLTGFTVNGNAALTVNSVDADWDDESGQVELRVEVMVQGPGSASKIGYQVTLLAQM